MEPAHVPVQKKVQKGVGPGPMMESLKRCFHSHPFDLSVIIWLQGWQLRAQLLCVILKKGRMNLGRP